MSKKKMILKNALTLSIVIVVEIVFIFSHVGNILAEVEKEKSLPQVNTRAEEPLIEADTKGNEKNKAEKIEEGKEIEKGEEAKSSEEKEKKKILEVEYKDGLLSVDLQNVDIIEVLKKIGEVANIEIEIGPGIEGMIEKIKFEKLTLEKAVERLIGTEGKGIVVEYSSEEKAKRLTLSKKLGEEVQKKEEDKLSREALSLPEDWPVSTIKRFDLRSPKVKNLYFKYRKSSKVEEEKYTSRFLFFDKNGTVVKEIIAKPVEKRVIERNGKKYLQFTTADYDISGNGETLAIVECLYDRYGEYDPNTGTVKGYEPADKRISCKLTYYNNNGDVLFEKDNYFFDGNKLKVSYTGDIIIVSENSNYHYLINPIKEFDERIHIFDRNGNELFKYDCDESIFHFRKKNGNEYLAGIIVRQRKDTPIRFKNYWDGVFFFDVQTKKYWIKFSEKPDTKIEILGIDDNGNALIKEQDKTYQLSKEGNLIK